MQARSALRKVGNGGKVGNAARVGKPLEGSGLSSTGVAFGAEPASLICALPMRLTRPDARQAVEDGKAESVSAYVADVLRHYGRSTTLRELLDQWWADDPGGPPSDAERAAAQAELGLPKPGLSQ